MKIARSRRKFYWGGTNFRVKAAAGMDLKEHIRGIPDFPTPGILFYDISTLLRDADAWSESSDMVSGCRR